jgi:hypothetical protein
MCLSVCTLMAFMIDEAHARCMEFHAWFNPYRWGPLLSLSPSLSATPFFLSRLPLLPLAPFLWPFGAFWAWRLKTPSHELATT